MRGCGPVVVGTFVSALAAQSLDSTSKGLKIHMTYKNNYTAKAALTALALLPTVTSAAGIYSGISGVTAGAPDNPIARGSITIFENSVVSYNPSPGVGSGFKNPAAGIASLGELYSPVAPPDGATTFDKKYRPIIGTEPNSFHNGSTTSPFGGNINDLTDSYGFIGIDAPGSITVGFASPIFDGAGADFAVFENGFSLGGTNSLFAELAYVEVSSNGTDFARFASISTNTAPTAVSGTFQGYDMTNVYNLAGKHASNWGTPFDLSQLSQHPLALAGTLNLSSILYVRLVDVVGSGALTDNGTPVPGVAVDSLGNPILDNYLTFDSAGFDYLGLGKAVGVIHSVPEPTVSLFVFCSLVSTLGLRKRRN